MKSKTFFSLLCLLLLSFAGKSQEGDMYQVILFRGNAQDYRVHQLRTGARISPSRYFAHFDRWAEVMNIQEACDVPVQRNLEPISSQIATTYENLARIIHNLELENREPEFYEEFQRKYNIFYSFLGYDPQTPLDFSTGLLTAYAYYQYVSRERVSSREFIDIFNFDYPELAEQLYFLEFSEYMADILEYMPEDVSVEKLTFELEEVSESLYEQWNLPYSPLQFISYNITLQIRASFSDLKEVMGSLADQMMVKKLVKEEDLLLFEGELWIGLYYRPIP